MKVAPMKRKPRDLAKFTSPKNAAQILRKLATALATSDPSNLVFIHMRIRVAHPEAKPVGRQKEEGIA